MNIFHLYNREQPKALDHLDKLPEKGFVWLDFVRDQEPDWHITVEKLTGVTIHERHVHDSLNAEHSSYYEGTSLYEMVIFRSLSPESEDSIFASRASCFFLLDRLLITVHAPDSRSFALVKEKLTSRSCRIPLRPVGLMHLVLSAMVDRFLALREPLTEQLEVWRRDLLDPSHPFDDWLSVMGHRSQLRTLEILCEEQEDALTNWRDNTSVEIDDHLSVRFNDLIEHIRRVMKHSTDQQHEVESLVQLHFSAVAHRTNEIMRMLTVLSAIFLPLSLVAGIFGMNFENMPELHYPYAYFIVLGGMLLLAVVLLVLFRKRRWI